MSTDNSQENNVNEMINFFQSGKFDKAENIAKIIVKKSPENIVGWKVLTAIYSQNLKLDDALAASNEAIKINPKDPETYNNKAMVLLKLNKIKEAEEFCKKSIELNENFFDGHNTLGMIYEKSDKFDEAKLCYSISININPNFINAYYNLGNLFRKFNKYEEAVINYKKAIELKPNFYQALNNMGSALKNLGTLDESLNCYKESIKYNPKFRDAHNNLNVLKKEIILMGKIDNSSSNLSNNKVNFVKENDDLFITNRNVESELIESLYKIKATDLDNVDSGYLRYGQGMSSDYNLFENKLKILDVVSKDLIKVMKDCVNSDIFILESFFNIFKTGSGITEHNHISEFDNSNNLTNKKYSLVYYLNVGDQNCDKPGYLQLYNPDKKVLPTNGMIMIFPSARKHKAEYGGEKDRVMIGVNFYRLN